MIRIIRKILNSKKLCCSKCYSTRLIINRVFGVIKCQKCEHKTIITEDYGSCYVSS